MTPTPPLPLEDLVTAVYCALDDALAHAGIQCQQGKLIPRRGPPPEVDDREILCLAVLQELLRFKSDNAFCLWLEAQPTMKALFPKRLPRQKFAQRRTLLTPLIQRLCAALCTLAEGHPPFSLWTPIRSRSAESCAPASASASAAWPPPAIALR